MVRLEGIVTSTITLMNSRFIQDELARLNAWMSHPGEVDCENFQISRYNLHRGEKPKILIQYELKQRNKQSGVKLVPCGLLNKMRPPSTNKIGDNK